MTILLFDHPLSPYSQKIKIALSEKGIAFEAPTPADLGSGRVSADFATASPRGEVPAIVDGDARIFDSTIILDYLEDRYPSPSLLPADPLTRARMRMIEDVMDTHYEAITWGLSEIRNFGRASGALADEMQQRGREQLARWHAWLEAKLGSADWFGGARFDRTDLAVVPFVNGATGFDMGPSPASALGRFMARANERPSVAAARADIARFARAMSDATGGLASARAAIESGAFRREYRDHRLEWMVRTGGLSVVSDGIAKKNVRFIEEFAP